MIKDVLSFDDLSVAVSGVYAMFFVDCRVCLLQGREIKLTKIERTNVENNIRISNSLFQHFDFQPLNFSVCEGTLPPPQSPKPASLPAWQLSSIAIYVRTDVKLIQTTCVVVKNRGYP